MLLPSGQEVLYDIEDSSLVERYKWYAHPTGRSIYARIGPCAALKPEQKRQLMHCLIMGNPPKGHCIDHINGNGLDNRRVNLRFATKAQNSRNQRVQIGKMYKGITKDKTGWTARIILGTFSTPEEAALAYNKAAIQFFGEFACLNEVPND